ncbi:MAG: DJ-1/PfpI family protein [Helicobacteraceae bacterium]|nr:DJ-1/PfpI family protein [Helicobacteraceae bacterium]
MLKTKLVLGVLLFEGFELLDVCGPLEIFGRASEHFEIKLVSELSGDVKSAQSVKLVTDHSFSDDENYDMLLIPGGVGTRVLVNSEATLTWLKNNTPKAQLVASVCTGSALLAKANLLDNKKATTNKAAFMWVTEQSNKVEWIKQARWVEDGKFFSSSGVSAGMDMSLAIISKLLGEEEANSIATFIEYEWHKDSSWDPFSKIYGLS